MAAPAGSRSFSSEPTPIYWDFDDPKNFAADGPTPGTWLFSNGQSGPVGREADGVPAQVKAPAHSGASNSMPTTWRWD